MKNQEAMGKCVVCKKETKRRHILIETISIFDPEGQKIVWQRIWSERELPLCEGCVTTMGKQLVEFQQSLQRAFELLGAQDEKPTKH